MPAEEARPDPDALIKAARREGHGRLRVFLGAAPGVGKTWEMLNAARRRRADGIDVVIGVVETHGRAETAEQIGDLPVLPRRAVPYHGHALEEFDLDAALARRPGLLLVDELAHTNAPGSRHNKRWEDVAELLEAGIDVWATLNVQHLESLNDAIARITGIRVTETLPDRVLELADEIELIDLSPAELRARLTEGHVYPREVAARALAGFFREGNLAALREIALRRAAQRVDQDVRDYMRMNAIAGPWPAGERVLALIGGDETAPAVVRAAKALADALHAPWIALHLERPDGADVARSALDLASRLGAEVEIRAGLDVVRAVLDVARARNVTHLVIGRGRPLLWRRLFGRTLAATLIREGPDFALHVVPTGRSAPARRRLPAVPLPRTAWPWLAATLLVGGVIGAGELFAAWLENDALGMLFVAAVVGSAALFGLAVALYAAVLGFLAWNLLFIPPLYQLTIYEPRDVVALLVFLGVAVATGWLASRVRLEARVAQSRIENLRRIAAFSRRLGQPSTALELHEEITRQAADIAGRAVLLTAIGEDLNIRAAMPPADTMDEGSWAAARWAYGRGDEAGRGTATLPSSPWRFFPMRAAHGMAGVLGVRPEGGLDEAAVQALGTLADQGGAALERVRLTGEAARAEAQAETQRLRTALLNALSHDLRTPLTGIRGAAGTLRTAWERLPAATRTDLLATIETDTVRMARFIANITEMTRLESGEITPRREPVDLAETLDAALAQVPAIGPVARVLPDAIPPVLADPELLSHALVNILENAAKHAPAGTPVSIGVQTLGPQVRLAVADQGPGIAEHDLPHVFDSFYRALREDRTTPGTGLGLAITRALVEAMGGTVEAASPRPNAHPGEPPGTEIRLTLPAAGPGGPGALTR